MSENGKDWTPLTVTETRADAQGNARLYTYDFAPVTATFVRMTVTNADVQTGTTAKPCTAITEVELNTAQGSFVTNATAKLASLKVNGTAVPDSALKQGGYNTPAETAKVEPVAADNAAVTVLPAHDDKVLIIIESEDHKTRSTFTVNLSAPETMDPADDSRDYPVDKIVNTETGSVHEPASGNEGPLSFAFDKNNETYYHSHWTATTLDNLWVTMELEEPTAIDGLRYLPRPASSGSHNGTLFGAKLQYSEDGKTWKDAGTATWLSPEDADYTRDWKLLQLAKPVTAKYFRLQATATYADGGRNNAFLSAAELRLTKAKSTTTDIASDAVSIEVPASVTVDRVDAEHPVDASVVSVVVKHGEKTLENGVDYTLEFADNTAAGTGKVTVKGMGKDAGSVERTFENQGCRARARGHRHQIGSLEDHVQGRREARARRLGADAELLQWRRRRC